MSKKTARTAQDLRAHNRGAVLRLLRDRGPLPRTALARRTGLSATTITKVVAALIEDGCVTEGGTALPGDGSGPRVGRPATDVALVPGAFAVCGVQVGAGTVHIGVSDALCRVEHTESFRYEAADAPAAVVDRIGAAVAGLVERGVLPADRLLGVGVAAPGPVDPGQRRILLSINLGWRDVDFAGPLERRLGVPAVVEHNVRAMALAEARYGRGRGAHSLGYVYVRTGVGAGLVFDGEPFRGGTHGATELGHLKVVEKGRTCTCGATGCLETEVSEPRLRERLALLGTEVPEGDSPLAALESAADAGDTRARDLLEGLTRQLTTGLTPMVNLLNPELLLLGGIFAGAADPTVDRLRTALDAQVFPLLRGSVRLERSGLGLDAGIAGGAAIALDRFFYTA